MVNFRTDYNWDKIIDPITDNEAKTWIASLRSGKFKQGKKRLHRVEDNTYCCLGVLQETANVYPEEIGRHVLRKPTPWGGVIWYKIPAGLQSILISMNDTIDENKYTFENIADFLEEGFFGHDCT